MLKRILVLPFLVMSLASCSPSEDPDKPVDDKKIPISSYSIFYQDSSEQVAKEFCDAINESTSYWLTYLKNENVDTSVPSFNFVIDDSLNQNVFKIDRVNKSYKISSNSDLGLLNAAKDLFDRILNSSDQDGNKLYESDYQESYSENKIKIMSFNVRVANDGTLYNGDKGDINDRAPRILKCIKQYMPDSLGVQEANDTWVTKLKAGLVPQYGYCGWGRESTYLGEASGIFYNRDTVTLVDSGTKWLSTTPDVPGSHFDNYGGYNRIFTYAILRRNADNYVYMHINTHLDLSSAPRLRDAQAIDDFANNYKDKLPIFVTGDYNCQKETPNDAVSYLINDCNYIDALVEAKDVTSASTFPQVGYYSPESHSQEYVIDHCLRANKGMFFTKYLVDTDKYSGDGVEAPQLTSDHYPLYIEANLYRPLIDFVPLGETKDVQIDNQFSIYDHEMNMISTSSSYENHQTILAVNATHNGQVKESSVSLTKYQCVGNLGKSGGYIQYSFTSDVAKKGDLVLVLSSSNYQGNGSSANSYMKNLSNYVTLSLNNSALDISGINLRNTDIKQYYEWEQLVLRDVDIHEGTNTLRMAAVGSTCPNQLLLEIFS